MASALNDLPASAKALEGELVALRKQLHQHPELSHQEVETSSTIARLLGGMDMNVQVGIGGHGVVADLEGSRSGPTVALRADMDALLIQEETGLAFASVRPGIMHACGHDAHTAILYGAAKLLTNRKEQLAGNVRFIFQPAEEINAGAQAMIEAGVLEGVDEIYGLRCQAELHYEEKVPILVNHVEQVRIVEEAIDRIYGYGNRIEAKQILAGEDFSLYLKHVPGCFFWIGSGPTGHAEQAYGLHHPKFDIHENCLAMGSALLAGIVLKRLGRTQGDSE
ncbi:metal-dependent amidase/aminoacylase/carboxypeptidase family protein [Paenibacillus endophyticus]|uniref:Metal-dependent amidase/aminoacylase/carboxypeptidase family protein n=1 Tax=Paenibacillus endophyticus TaxID=1294268 RepID=A0A7W5C638_9BACL|nr:amidohydrolase [Paenibacillus endophyticus]MBB3151835.1 metal-dependent amidase/aminoacylase/carboxypeptidase family protein [Paenibacillus endophyticus]